MEEAAQ